MTQKTRIAWDAQARHKRPVVVGFRATLLGRVKERGERVARPIPNDGLKIGWLPEVSCWRGGVGEANGPSTTMIRNGCEERAKNNQEVGPRQRPALGEKLSWTFHLNCCERSSVIEKPDRSATS